MALKLNDNQKEELQNAINDEAIDIGVKRKIIIIQDYISADDKKTTALKYNVSSKTIQRWINSYLGTSKNNNFNGGMSNLKDKEFKKTKILTKEKMYTIVDMLSMNPLEYGLLYSTWDEHTVSLLIEANPQLGLINSKTTIAKILTVAGNKYQLKFYDKNYEQTAQNINDNYFSEKLKLYEKDEWFEVLHFSHIYIGKTFKASRKKCKNQFVQELGTDNLKIVENKNPRGKTEHYHLVTVYGDWGFNYNLLVPSNSIKFSCSDKLGVLQDIHKYLITVVSKFCILFDLENSTREAINLYNQGHDDRGFIYMTLPNKMHENHEKGKFLADIKNYITFNESESNKKRWFSKNFDIGAFSEEDCDLITNKMCFSSKGIKTIHKYFSLLIKAKLQKLEKETNSKTKDTKEKIYQQNIEKEYEDEKYATVVELEKFLNIEHNSLKDKLDYDTYCEYLLMMCNMNELPFKGLIQGTGMKRIKSDKVKKI